MVRAKPQFAEKAVCALLETNAWHTPVIKKMKQLPDPFKSDDPDMIDCYNGAIEKDGGIIVNSDPILEGDAEN